MDPNFYSFVDFGILHVYIYLHGSKKSQAGMLDSRVLSSILSSWPNFSIAMELVAFC